MRHSVLVGGLVVMGLAGCAAVSPTQVGQTAGGIAGAAIAPGIGMPLGALLGTLAGLVVEQHLDKLREQQEHVELSRQLRTSPTPSSPASSQQPIGRPTRVWVDEGVEEGRLMAGRFELRAIP